MNLDDNYEIKGNWIFCNIIVFINNGVFAEF